LLQNIFLPYLFLFFLLFPLFFFVFFSCFCPFLVPFVLSSSFTTLTLAPLALCAWGAFRYFATYFNAVILLDFYIVWVYNTGRKFAPAVEYGEQKKRKNYVTFKRALRRVGMWQPPNLAEI